MVSKACLSLPPVVPREGLWVRGALPKACRVRSLGVNSQFWGKKFFAAGQKYLPTRGEAQPLAPHLLQTLSLDSNSVADAGASSLASALEQNTTLQTLHLGGNSVGDAGRDALGKHGGRVSYMY